MKFKKLLETNKQVKKLWEDYLELFNYVDDKMVEGCEQAKKVLTKINK